jgi:hypothetical protein
MRKILMGVLAAAIITLAVGASAQARPWAHCHNWSCVNKHLNSLHKTAARTSRRVNHLLTCMAEAPLTQYGDPTGVGGGYLYRPKDNSGGFTTAALDLTQPGDPASGRFLLDTCTGSSRATAIAPMAHLRAFSASLKRSP